MTTPRIFISYSHEDVRWKDLLLDHLRVLERRGVAEIWDTSSVDAGTDWAKEIAKALKDADIAVLLISPDFLASDFIVANELPVLLERRRDEGLIVLPIVVRPSLWKAVPEIAELQFANDPSQPLAAATDAELDRSLASISQRIAELAETVAERSAAIEAGPSRQSGRSWLGPRRVARPENADAGFKRAGPEVASPEGHLFVSHSKEDGDFAELLKLRLEREGRDAWIDTDRLEPGRDWRSEIDQAIKDAAAVVAIMSPDARASEYVTYEWAYAWGCGTKVIPIMLRQTPLHPRLATLQYLDFTNRTARPWTRLLEVLSQAGDESESSDDTPEG